MVEKDFKHVVRVANTDLDGAKPIYISLRKIKGVDFMFSNMVCHIANISKEKKTGELTDEEVSRLDEIIRNPVKFGAPNWMLNRRKDIETGVDKHLVGADLIFTVDSDTKRMKKIKCYSGVRHMFGQPVRGQRTRSNFRKNKGRVHLGVKKRAGAKAGKV